MGGARLGCVEILKLSVNNLATCMNNIKPLMFVKSGNLIRSFCDSNICQNMFEAVIFLCSAMFWMLVVHSFKPQDLHGNQIQFQLLIKNRFSIGILKFINSKVES